MITKDMINKAAKDIFRNIATIIYHRSDLDGVASAAIAGDYYEKCGYNVILNGWTYGDNLSFDYADSMFIADVSFGEKHEEILHKWVDDDRNVVWCDHHKTAIFDKDGSPACSFVPGIRKIGKAACELVWEYLYPDRDVPELIQYLSAYDVWDKNRYDWDDVIALQYGVRAAVGLDVNKMKDLLYGDYDVKSLMDSGRKILSFLSGKNREECNQFGFAGGVCGYTAICMNTLEFNSTSFESKAYDFDLMVPFAILPNGKVRFSLYTASPDMDCSAIARAFGGGGHKGAAGFMLDVSDERVGRFFKEHELD